MTSLVEHNWFSERATRVAGIVTSVLAYLFLVVFFYKKTSDVLATGVAAVLIAGIGAVFSRRVHEMLAGFFEKNPWHVICAPAFVFGLYLVYTLGNDVWNGEQALRIGTYFFVPAIFIALTRNVANRFPVLDLLVVLWMWIPFDLRLLGQLLGKSWGAASSTVSSYPFMAFAAVIFLVVIFGVYRRLPAMKFIDGDGGTGCVSAWRNTLLTASALGMVLVTVVPLGMYLGFLKPKPFLLEIGGGTEFFTALTGPLLTFRFWGYLLPILFITALPEETVFRAAMQNVIGRMMPTKEFTVLLITAFVFGLSHFEGYVKDFSVLEPWRWNWTYIVLASIAGLFYGYVYLRTNRIIYPVILHGFVDAIWGTYFLKPEKLSFPFYFGS